MVFQELAPTQIHKAKTRDDLERELFGSSESGNDTRLKVRDNEGMAAELGIYFDDTQYDYMQHIRELNSGSGDGEAHFVEATAKKQNGKGKARMSLEDALRESSLRETPSEMSRNDEKELLSLEDNFLPLRGINKTRYQDQQDVPDVLAGFQPDMDPRLREVLEALDDEAYVDDEEEFFGELAKDGQEVDLDEFEGTGFDRDDMDDAGWETDETEKPSNEYKPQNLPSSPPLFSPENDTHMTDGPDHGDGDWMKEFSKFKQADKASKPNLRAPNSDLQSSVITGSSGIGGRRKKRQGAKTSSTGYSMTSSSLFRTEGQTLLDARFDKIEEEYAEDDLEMGDDTASMMTSSSLASSQAPPLAIRSGFDSIMDDFLDGYSQSGKKRVKKGGYQSGMEQLNEIRKELGPARAKVQKV